MTIRDIRIAAKMRLGDLAVRANVSGNQLSKCERGLIVPDLDFFYSVALALAAPPDQLLQAHKLLYERAVMGEGYTTALPKTSGFFSRKSPIDTGKIPILDLFCGVGGFSHGFQQTGRYQVTTGIDLLPDRIATFRANHPTANAICGDIRTADLNVLYDAGAHPKVVIGGPPCQGFSSIRPFRALTDKDPRNNLFEHFLLTVDAVRPEWFVLENVVGLLRHKAGETLNHIVELFEEIGYTIEWKVLNSALYGLPQRRERLILIGNRNKKSFVWPQPTHYVSGKSMAGKQHGQFTDGFSLFSEPLKPAVTVMDAIHDLPEVASGEDALEYRNDIALTDYEAEMRQYQSSLTLHSATRHSPKMLEIIRLSGSSRNALPEGITNSGFSSSYSRLEPNLPSVTLTVNFVHPSSNKCIHPFQDRALTPREGARLQGFHDAYSFIGSRAQIIKQIGNAVPPLLGRIIAQALWNQL